MQLTEYWTYHGFPMSLYPRLPCGFVRESESHSCYSGWLVGWCCARLAAGRLSQAPSDGEWIFKQCWAAIRKSVWDLCPFVLGLTASSKLSSSGGNLWPPVPHHPSSQNIHARSLCSLCPICSQKCGWFPVTRLPSPFIVKDKRWWPQ